MTEKMVQMPPCPIHGTATVCPRCSGAKGGKIGGRSMSAKKIRAIRRNAQLSRGAAGALRRAQKGD
jgi:hypothetical protein